MAHSLNPFRDGRPADPFGDPLDAILAEIAINLQLPPGLHAKAVERYEAVCRHVDRPGSPLEGRVSSFYPQGSMAIDATISTRGTDDEYDLDAVAEILGGNEGPEALLDLLERALKGYTVSRIERKTRCITLFYADGMHLDVTPARRLAVKEKESVIAHAKKGRPSEHRYVPMNAFGFCAWYNDRTPVEERFAIALNRELYTKHGLAFYTADVEEVPDQTPLIIKNVTTVALQLIKRHRNILYADAAGRMPPSVMLSCHAGHAAMPGMALTDMVMRQARWTARAIDQAARQNKLLDVPNPEFYEERFTDRWPDNQARQRHYARALNTLADGLQAARESGMQLEDLQDWLREQFGERVVTRSVDAFNKRLGQQIRAGQHGYTRTGGLFTPAAPAIITGASALAPVAARAHTNMGERR
ncbi:MULTISPECIES: nucleotidyltransferase domain-containing protein [Mesorhizobium]|uniref:Cyclic GMP-AMP synthase n=2 Tax=Mesorhizobium TaxID=68287 RepID=A0AB38TIB1_9HYPH|nr:MULTISPECIES: nucleotidyltransferase [Mesorhizobium]MDF3217901.1 nucleotidyltransferase [Mesorhizobium ciceri]RUY66473.1 nucleotidyltransferase [Mesorhizobium sp. M7A.F.Ca.CA.001.05.1.1]RUY68354.1 nucleotidyltransferase [Mesorhizobium sp. M7A.F.Ca.CA.001.13.1.1]RUZ06855.1 nucleotidyltransferase [Mesorhizobium sp. M7A.F.Ca.CA.001.04.2.1]RUZ14127.1 nucleotidyltransferase [Mesorhizobium sp. M7A.F.Ca.CA.001.09.1.1]